MMATMPSSAEIDEWYERTVRELRLTEPKHTHGDGPLTHVLNVARRNGTEYRGKHALRRPWTDTEILGNGSRRIHVKRCCEVCGRPVGDVTEQEMDIATVGGCLPPCVDDCGCQEVRP